MRHSLKAVISLSMLGLAFVANALTIPVLPPCGYKEYRIKPQVPDATRLRYYKDELYEAGLRCGNVGNPSASIEYRSMASVCANSADKVEAGCEANFLALEKKWCGFTTGSKVGATDYAAKNQAVEAALGRCATAQYGGATYFNATVNGSVVRKNACQAADDNQKAVANQQAEVDQNIVNACNSMYDALFNVASPY